MNRPIRVNSIEEQEALITPCACGSNRLLTASEELSLVRRRWYDLLVVACAVCGRTSPWLFDVTSFYEPTPRVSLALAGWVAA